MENTEQSSAKVAPAAAPAGGGGAKERIEKQARQLAYDTRYKVKQSMSQKSGGKLDPAAVRKAYIGQLSKSPAPPQVKTRAKQMLLGEDIINVDDLLSTNIASTLEKVFVEGIEKVEEEVIEEDSGEKKFKVRVTDKKTNNSYVTNATRDKIRELRSNPNISSVEMTEYGAPTRSAGVVSQSDGKKKAKKDYDGDGTVESPTAEYKGSKDKAIKKAMKSENYDGFLELIEKSKEDKVGKKITGEGVNNSKLVKVFPDESSSTGASVKEEKVEEGLGTALGGAVAGGPGAGLVGAVTAKKGRKLKKAVAAGTGAALGGVIGAGALPGGATLGKAIGGYIGGKVADEYVPEDELTEEFINESVDHAVNYFSKAGLNEYGLERVIEEVGVEDFTEFVFDLTQQLNEERDAERDANPTPYAQVKAKVDKAEARRKEKGQREYAKGAKGGDPAPRKKKAAAKKEAPAKVEKAVAKAKKVQPARPISKPGLADRVRGAVTKGIERHKKAREAGRVPEARAKEFGKGVVSGVKTAVKAAKDVKKAVVGEEALQEKQKDTPDQVKAVIAFDKARKGTDDATYDSEHGDKKQAKKERDYAKWQRDKGAEDAQKSGHPWEHAKGSTREKEGKKSEKHAHIQDSAELVSLSKAYLSMYEDKEDVNEIVGMVAGGIAGNQLLAPALAKSGAAAALTKAGLGKGLAKAVTGKVASTALGAAAGETLDPFKKKKDKSPIGAAAGGAVGGLTAGALGASHELKGNPLSERKIVIKLAENPVQKAWNWFVPPASKSANPKVRSGEYTPNPAAKPGLDFFNNSAAAINQPIKGASSTIKTVKKGVDTAVKIAKGTPQALKGAGQFAKSAAIPVAAAVATKGVVDQMIGKNKGKVEEDYGTPVKDQTDAEIGDVTFDAGAALPATIKAIGDPREIPTSINLIKNKWRAQGLKPMAPMNEEQSILDEKLAKGTTGVSFSTGRDDNSNQAMTAKNPKTGRQRGTSPESKAIGAHSRHKQKQWDAEAKGDHKAAAKHKSRRDAQSFKVYQKTKRIIDRADND